MKQLSHNEIENKQKKFPITIVCDALRTPENIGMCFRVSESFGVEKIYLHKNSVSLQNRKIQKTSRHTITKISHENYADFKHLIYHLKKEGNTIIGMEITDKSTAIQNFDFKKYPKIVLVLGSERQGISDVNLLDNSIKIPMFGSNSSMNVIHSLSIALYEITNQLI